MVPSINLIHVILSLTSAVFVCNHSTGKAAAKKEKQLSQTNTGATPETLAVAFFLGRELQSCDLKFLRIFRFLVTRMVHLFLGPPV